MGYGLWVYLQEAFSQPKLPRRTQWILNVAHSPFCSVPRDMGMPKQVERRVNCPDESVQLSCTCHYFQNKARTQEHRDTQQSILEKAQQQENSPRQRKPVSQDVFKEQEKAKVYHSMP